MSICLDEHDYFADGWSDGERSLGKRREVLKCAHCGSYATGKVLPANHPFFVNSFNEAADENT